MEARVGCTRALCGRIIYGGVPTLYGAKLARRIPDSRELASLRDVASQQVSGFVVKPDPIVPEETNGFPDAAGHIFRIALLLE